MGEYAVYLRLLLKWSVDIIKSYFQCLKFRNLFAHFLHSFQTPKDTTSTCFSGDNFSSFPTEKLWEVNVDSRTLIDSQVNLQKSVQILYLFFSLSASVTACTLNISSALPTSESSLLQFLLSLPQHAHRAIILDFFASLSSILYSCFHQNRLLERLTHLPAIICRITIL